MGQAAIPNTLLQWSQFLIWFDDHRQLKLNQETRTLFPGDDNHVRKCNAERGFHFYALKSNRGRNLFEFVDGFSSFMPGKVRTEGISWRREGLEQTIITGWMQTLILILGAASFLSSLVSLDFTQKLCSALLFGSEPVSFFFSLFYIYLIYIYIHTHFVGPFFFSYHSDLGIGILNISAIFMPSFPSKASFFYCTRW